MARIRTIKPEFFSSPDVCDLCYPARQAFQATWCEADREGRFRWNSRKIKLRYFPSDPEEEIAEALVELAKSGLLFFYRVDGVLYAHVVNFTKHQVINNRESQSELPEPDSGEPVEVVGSDEYGPIFGTREDASAREAHASGTRESGRKEGREGKEGRKEGNSPARAREDSELPFDDFWDVYPRKEGKAKAEAAWKRLKPDDRKAAIDDAPRRYAGVERQYIPHGPSYLNGRKWEDEHTPAKADDGNVEPLRFKQHTGDDDWRNDPRFRGLR